MFTDRYRADPRVRREPRRRRVASRPTQPIPARERAKEVLAAKDAPGAVDDAPDEPDSAEPDSEDTAVTAESPRDAMARRAWRSAVLGIVFLPVLLHLYSAALVVTYHLTGGSVAVRSRWRIHAALAIDTIVIVVAAAIVLR